MASKSVQAGPESDRSPYVSTSLDLLPAEACPNQASDPPSHIRFDARDYFRLTPDFHAWIVQCLASARKSAASGKLPPKTLATLERRFEAVQQAATALYTPGELAQAKPERPRVDTPHETKHGSFAGNSANVKAAPPYRFPPDAPGFTEAVRPGAVEQVRAIVPQALALGWSESSLLSNVGQFRLTGPGYGLVIYLSDGD